jgi:hypothetical protein
MTQIIKETPILFNTAMVQAIESGIKTMTRRIVKIDPAFENSHIDIRSDYETLDSGKRTAGLYAYFYDKDSEVYDTKCPYGHGQPDWGDRQPGDRLWVRETFFDCSKFKEADLFSHVVGDFIYKEDTDFIGCHKWKPSIHMPKVAARIWLEVISVRVERLNDITEQDAIKEGILYDKFLQKYGCNACEVRGSSSCRAGCEDGFFDNAKDPFKYLWQSIYGNESWVVNPWVWVVEFKRITNYTPRKNGIKKFNEKHEK